MNDQTTGSLVPRATRASAAQPDATAPVTTADGVKATPTSSADTSVTKAFDPTHQWPSEGGCYVRQADGTLTRED